MGNFFTGQTLEKIIISAKIISEIISEIALAMESESTVYELMNTVHPHPTISEAIHEAALDSFDKSIHQ